MRSEAGLIPGSKRLWGRVRGSVMLSDKALPMSPAERDMIDEHDALYQRYKWLEKAGNDMINAAQVGAMSPSETRHFLEAGGQALLSAAEFRGHLTRTFYGSTGDAGHLAWRQSLLNRSAYALADGAVVRSTARVMGRDELALLETKRTNQAESFVLEESGRKRQRT